MVTHNQIFAELILILASIDVRRYYLISLVVYDSSTESFQQLIISFSTIHNSGLTKRKFIILKFLTQKFMNPFQFEDVVIYETL